ncbi:hypothetical protein [Natrialba sp. SSL1]|uniref:hypothetical protein n=1 Tax=Natrialba sp. SSL1 TaxID=1869245 RepID=UPI0008F8C46A|nr:hypothetical protein [Natrialba sp. SSL1]OIB58912.1 hypothetical protein BBD46_06470 [Natrialba sp. SSL1]
MFPGHANPKQRLEEIQELNDVAEDVLEEHGIDLLELLTWPGKVQQEYFLIGHSNTFTHNQAIETPDEDDDGDSAAEESTSSKVSVDLAEYTDDGAPDAESDSDEMEPDTDSDQPVSTSGDNGDTRAQRIKNIVNDHFDGRIGAQICTLNLAPLGEMPVPTSRLLIPPNLTLDPVETSRKALTANLVRDLNEDRIAYLHQSLVTKAGSSDSHDYLVTSRLAPFGTGHGIVTESDLQTHLAAQDQYRISSYAPGPASDNWGLPIGPHRRYANQQTSHPSKLEQFDEMSLRQGSIEDLAAGYPEYRALLSGRVYSDDRYSELFGVYGRLPVSKANLLHFLAISPSYFDADSFDGLATTDAPEYHTTSLDAEIPGTRQSYGVEEAGDTTTVVDSSDEESLPHKELVNSRVRFLVRHGHTIIAVDQDVLDADIDISGEDPTETQYLEGESRPDIVSENEGVIHFHEVEVENKTKPSALITNLARAVHHDHPVHIITETRRDAESKLWSLTDEAKKGPVSMPFKRTDEKGTILYNLDKAAHQDKEVWYLLPRDQTEAIWRLTPDDRLQLVGEGGTILAEGDAEAPAGSFVFHTPRVRQDGNEWVLETSGGEILRRRQSKRAAASGYPYIRLPCVAPRFEFLENTTVEFESENGFTIFDKPPKWERPHENDSVRYEEATKTFVELVTVEKQDAEIPIPKLRRRFKSWYRTQTDLKEPNETWFGRALRAYFDVDDSDDHNKTLVGRTFRFSEGLLSPDLSFVDDESE